MSETTVTPGSEGLPPGVQTVGGGTPPNTAAPVVENNATPPNSFNDGGNVNSTGKWDLLQMGGYILVLVTAFYFVNYLIERTYTDRADSKEKEKKIQQLQKEVTEIKQDLQQS